MAKLRFHLIFQVHNLLFKLFDHIYAGGIKGAQYISYKMDSPWFWQGLIRRNFEYSLCHPPEYTNFWLLRIYNILLMHQIPRIFLEDPSFNKTNVLFRKLELCWTVLVREYRFVLVYVETKAVILNFILQYTFRFFSGIYSCLFGSCISPLLFRITWTVVLWLS